MVEHTAYGVLVNGEGVCDGYSRAYQDLLGRVGITSVVVESRPMYHAWNMVSLGGELVSRRRDLRRPDHLGPGRLGGARR